MIFSSFSFRSVRALGAAFEFVLSCGIANAAVTVTDANDVVYDIVEGTTDVVVSINNASVFKNRIDAIIIPATVTDAADTSNDHTTVYTVTGISESAFRETSITEFTLEAPLTEIPENCFANCEQLTTVSLPTSITKIGDQAFYTQDWGKTSRLVTVTGIENVTEMGVRAFSYATSLVNISLPAGLETMGNACFRHCTSLEGVTIPGTLKVVPESAFDECSGLKKVVISEGVKTLMEGSFSSCTSLEDLQLCEGLELQTGAFRYTNPDTGFVLRLKKGMTVHGSVFTDAGISAIEWPDEAIEIEQYAFASIYKLTKLTIPRWMKVVPQNCFERCQNTQEIELEEGVEEIGDYAFYYYMSRYGVYYTELQKVSFAEGATNTLKKVGEQSFQNARYLTEFPFAENQEIGKSAFESAGFTSLDLKKGMSVGDKGLAAGGVMEITWPDEPMGTLGNNIFGSLKMTVISFPAWMTEIPDGICKDWNALTTATIHEGVTRIGKEAFSNCYKLTVPVLPETLTEIDDRAYYVSSVSGKDLSSNWTLVLPESLRRIGQYAFAKRWRINAVTFNEGLEEIGDNAFQDCASFYSYYMNNIALPSTLTRLGVSAFEGCSQTTQVDLSATKLTTISARAFYGCTRLAKVTWPTALSTIGDNAFYNSVINSTSTTMLPASVTEVGMRAFYTTSTSSQNVFLDLTNVKKIGIEAFGGLNIRQITWGSEPIEIGYGCFTNIRGLAEATFPDWMTETVEKMYKGATAIWDINFNNIKIIAAETFRDCLYLRCYPHETSNTSEDRILTIPATVEHIGQNAFYNTGYYESNKHPYIIELPDGVTVGNGAFKNANIAEIRFKGCADINGQAFAGTPIKKLTLPECMTDIPDQFFMGMRSLEEVEMPEGLRAIGMSAFNNCTSLTSVSFPETLEQIKDYAFQYSGLTAIEWPARKVEMGRSVFANTQVTEVTIPAWMDSVPHSVFQNCQQLAGIKYEPRNGSPLKIGDYAFQSCYNLSSIDLPEGVTHVGVHSFDYCNNVTAITLPSTLTAISDYAFYYCPKVTELDLSHVTQLGESAFYAPNSLTSLKFNDGLKRIPSSCFNGINVLPELNLPSALTYIGDCAFQDCYALREINLPEGVDSIGSYAFRQHLKVKRLELPASLRYVGSMAFSGNTSASYHYIDYYPSSLRQTVEESKTWENVSELEEVVSHATNMRPGDSMFENCYKLRTFRSDFPVRYITTNMFENCINLEEVIFPEDTEFVLVHDDAFYKCASLKAFPYKTIARFGSNSFRSCLSMKQFYFPTGGDYIFHDSDPDKNYFYASYYDWYDDDEGWHNCRDFFYGGQTENHYMRFADYMENLQSIVIPYTGRFMKLFEYNIESAPLRGVSYCYADNIIPQSLRMPKYFEAEQPRATIRSYGANGDYYYAEGGVVDAEESILMVMRGEKWKFEEAGYGKRFNIIEMKNPKPSLEGDIFSTFDKDENVNHYKAILRWEVELSDLNEAGETRSELWRDGVKIADVTFSKPVEKTGAELSLDAERVIEVTVNVDAAEGHNISAGFRGDYDYPVELKGDNDSETRTLWVMEYNMQDDKLYFDAESGARLNAFERYGYRSLLTMMDEFDSPNLDSGNVPKLYTYKVRTYGYDYEEYVNNDDFEPGEDGHRYHKEKRSLPAEIWSDDCLIYPATAEMAVSCTGMYTKEEIVNDRDRSLATVPADPNARNYKLSGRLDPVLATQQVYVVATDQLHDVISGVEVFKAPETEEQAVYRYSHSRRKAGSDELEEGMDALDPKVGEKYQAEITSYNRGTFGTPVFTVPDMPTLESELAVFPHEHMPTAIHTHGSFYGQMFLTPDVTPLGYDKAMPAEGDYYLGVWRTLDMTDRESAAWADGISALDDTAPELIHHTEGRPAETTEAHCADCASGTSCEATESQIVHTDVFDVEQLKLFEVAYDARLYAKVPTALTGGDERWVAVDTRQSQRGDVLTGTENIAVDREDGEGDVMWYDLQGRRVVNPAAGNTYIKVTKNGNSKVRYL